MSTNVWIDEERSEVQSVHVANFAVVVDWM